MPIAILRRHFLCFLPIWPSCAPSLSHTCTDWRGQQAARLAPLALIAIIVAIIIAIATARSSCSLVGIILASPLPARADTDSIAIAIGSPCSSGCG
jgi:hypothetical protein